MSSTKRGRARIRHDTYPTPAWAVRRLLECLKLPNGRWLEPCAGDGAIITAVNSMLEPMKIEWSAYEIRKGPIPKLSHCGLNIAVQQADFLALDGFGEENRRFYDVAITNPPFIHAMPFITRCLHLSDHVVMLLRLNFLASEKRAPFMRGTHPDIYVLPNRPSFVGGGKTDSIEYAWFHWWEGSSGKTTILNSTPADERHARRPRV